MMHLLRFSTILAILATGPWCLGATIVDFGDLCLAPESHYNGTDTVPGNGAGETTYFSSRGVSFGTYRDEGAWSYWDGWAYTNHTDTTTAGYTNQYSAATGNGHGDANYAIGYFGFIGNPVSISLPVPTCVESLCITNTTYAYLILRDGDVNNIARKFVPGDSFTLTITGRDIAGESLGDVVFSLANGTDIVNEWAQIDLTSFGDNVSSLEFALDSSDWGEYGMNTPAYFAIDDLTVSAVPEPSTIALVGLLAMLGAARFWMKRA